MVKKLHESPPQQQSNLVQLPLMGNVAIYTRVATQDKLPQNDLLSQVESLKQFAQTLGYTTEQITLFTDESIQATAPLFERKGYTALVSAIRSGQVNVLLIADVSRLLQYAIEAQVSAFIHVCMEKGVYVATPTHVYDFSNLTSVHQFRVACMQAFQILQEAYVSREN